ncbi:ArsR/SmtB family transcription factor [Streptomyces sp. NPDC015220]|uniref:ArsR/SmtB family transcription factor n=1 Tax=Streptomyces sp. NPDC015220 TaxID=3364947 RepID=UPI0036F8615E
MAYPMRAPAGADGPRPAPVPHCGDLPLAGDADISAVAQLIADPSRAAVLLALQDGRALPASVLAAEAGVSASTISGHLARLLDARMVTAERHGRYRYYRIAGPEVAELLERLAALSPPRPVRSLREGNRGQALRAARTCYDHLAGRLGVAVLQRMLAAGHLTGGDGQRHPDTAVLDGLTGYGRDVSYQLTDTGVWFLHRLGAVDTPEHRPAIRYCVDWSEQQHHLAGELGRLLLARALRGEWIVRAAKNRSVRVTDRGRAALRQHFQLDW